MAPTEAGATTVAADDPFAGAKHWLQKVADAPLSAPHDPHFVLSLIVKMSE
ncbi:MAG: hypothetical protein M3174_08165 [Actinomycetota bacterium]|nr:hypothetical protein [Actinomycetota bacterium]